MQHDFYDAHLAHDQSKSKKAQDSQGYYLPRITAEQLSRFFSKAHKHKPQSSHSPHTARTGVNQFQTSALDYPSHEAAHWRSQADEEEWGAWVDASDQLKPDCSRDEGVQESCGWADNASTPAAFDREKLDLTANEWCHEWTGNSPNTPQRRPKSFRLKPDSTKLSGPRMAPESHAQSAEWHTPWADVRGTARFEGESDKDCMLATADDNCAMDSDAWPSEKFDTRENVLCGAHDEDVQFNPWEDIYSSAFP